MSAQQDALAELSLMRDDVSLAQQLTGMGHCVFDLKLGRQACSTQHCRNVGLDHGAMPDSMEAGVALLLGQVDARDRERAAAALRACIDAGQPFDAEWRVRPQREGDEGRILRVEGIREDDPDGSPRALVFASVDLTERRRTEESLRQTRLDLTRAQRIARVGTWTVDFTRGKAIMTAEETRKVFGFDSPEVPLAFLNSRIHPDDLPAVETARRVCLAHPGTGYYVQYRTIPAPGELRYVESQGEVQADAAGAAVRMVGYLRDITEAKLAEQEIQRLAYQDEVTGLPNRVSLARRLEQATMVDAPDFVPLALMVVDVARFQDICLTLGTMNSDALLRDVAVRIRQTFGERVFVARTGGAQFAVLLSDADTYDSKPCARAILKAFEAPFPVAGIHYDINVHIGVALFPGHASDPATLFRKANVAVFRARQIGTELLVYQPEDDPTSRSGWPCLANSARPSRMGRSSCTASPRSRCAAATWSARKRWYAGAIRAWAWSRPACSFRWSKTRS
ncbi:diguanylate cyclase domain-containing protein [Massilia sp. ST3]|uniref:diguanylate cyclase domain-containing protein n=1 Tax=Massilia sp. ST3 TaxID=2824903 RepID=UPI001B825CDB|nr:diguanylate cyclase [Massilia sp. ST3]